MADIFTVHAHTYDRARKKLIPCFDKFYGTPSEIIRAYGINPQKCLDLGAGTGLLSAIVMQDFNIEQLVLFDQSEAMLELGTKALSERLSLVAIVAKLQNINDYPLSGEFDAIWSALAIHHLSASEKRQLFKDVYNQLKLGGIFVNADQSLGKTKQIEKIYRDQWLKEVRACGVTKDDLSNALERIKEDRMDTLESQLGWLSEAGFSQVNVWFQDHSFNVYSGIRDS